MSAGRKIAHSGTNRAARKPWPVSPEIRIKPSQIRKQALSIQLSAESGLRRGIGGWARLRRTPGRSSWNGLRVAIVHHWFITRAGGERVFDTIASIFPTADVFTLFLDKQKFPPALNQHKITTSFLDKIPAARKVHRHFLPFYPLAVEMLDLSGYDLVITSDSGPMKGVLTDPHSTHICYCHSPMRYLWDGHSAYHRSMSPLSKPSSV